MPEDSIEIVRKGYESLNETGIEGALAFMDPAIEMELAPELTPEPQTLRGHAGVRRWLDDLARDWEYFEPCYEEYHDLGDRVLILGRWRARGRSSGVELTNQPAAWLYEIKDGRAVWMRTFTDRAEALESAGVSEQDISQTHDAAEH